MNILKQINHTQTEVDTKQLRKTQLFEYPKSRIQSTVEVSIEGFFDVSEECSNEVPSLLRSEHKQSESKQLLKTRRSFDFE